MKFMYGIHRALLYFLFFTGTLIATPILLLIALVFNKHTANFFPRYYARLLTFCIPVKLEISGLDNIKKGESYVITCNHRSLMDIVAVYAALKVDIRWVMKQELTKIPFFGQSSIILGNIPIDRRNPKRAVESINKAKKEIRNGVCVAFFPEGTRINNADIAPFKKGAFHFALETQLPVLPVAILGSDKVMPKNTLKFKPGTIRVIVHPEVSIEGHSKKFVNNLSDEVQNILHSTIKKEYTPAGRMRNLNG